MKSKTSSVLFQHNLWSLVSYKSILEGTRREVMQPTNHCHGSNAILEYQNSPCNIWIDEVEIIDDRPIVLREGTRSCTNHPVSNFISYGKRSPNQHVFVSNLDRIQVSSVNEALSIPKCKKSGRNSSTRKERNLDDIWSTWRKKGRCIASGFLLSNTTRMVVSTSLKLVWWPRDLHTLMELITERLCTCG